MSETHTLMRLNREAQAKLAEREAALDERVVRLRAEIEKALADKAEVGAEREALAKAERVYGRLFGPVAVDKLTLADFSAKVPDLEAQISRQEAAKPRARLGPQRYLMFAALSETCSVSLLALAQDTGLSPKRVKDQMVSDIRLGLVAPDEDDTYRLTPAGKDLLDRYRAYKKAHNQPLPSLDDPPTEDDQDEPETEDMMEGATQE